MLNELYDLSRSLDRLGIDVISWHRYLKECPRGKTFFIDVDAASKVTDVREISDPDRLAGLRKYEKAAGYSFPSFNILPLWQFDDKAARESAVALRKSLASKSPLGTGDASKAIADLLTKARSTWIDPQKKASGRDAMDKVNGCLGGVVNDLIQLMGDLDNEAGKSLSALLDRTKKLDGTALHCQLSQWFTTQFELGHANSVTWFDLLFFSSGKTPKSVSIVFELAEQSEFDFPANHQRVYEVANTRLLEEPQKKTKTPGKYGPDAYAETDGGRDDSFPEIKMSRFGKINLRAMSKESLCQVRYGVAESKSFPVGKSIRQECKNSLEWISRDERKGLTWSDLSSANGASTVLFAYPSRLTEQPPQMAFLLSGDEDPSSLHNEGQFEACSQTIAKSLSGRVATEDLRDVVIFVLTKPDGFRTKVLFSNRCSESHFLQSAREWEMGCLNIPSIKSRQFGPEKGDKPSWRTPLTPFTTEIIGCLNSVWRRGGTEAATCKTVRVADALSLLLDGGQQQYQTASNLLEALLKNTSGLLLATGQASILGNVHAVARNLQKHQLLLPRILGLLLWKLGIKKGDYMKTPAFWVGRMLSVADQLHLQYCRQVRKGEIPPQLVGNSLMSTALSTPEHALSVLAERIKPYYAWAQTVQVGEKIALTKYFLGQLGSVATKLAELELPKRTNDADRAAMLLGYLSRSEKDQSTTEDKGESANDDSN